MCYYFYMIVNLYIMDIRHKSVDGLIPYLTNEDNFKIQKCKVNDVKREKIASAYLKNKYIGEYYLGDYNKPLSDDIFFNISHSNGVIILGTNLEKNIGVDVEFIENSSSEMRRYISSDEEFEYITNDIKFTEVWTNKESLVKAIGAGINTNFPEIISLPINGTKTYLGKNYTTKNFRYEDFIISITLEGDEDFEVNLIMEDVL